MPEYMLLIYGDPAAVGDPDVGEDRLARWYEYTNALEEAGALRGGNALEPIDAATTVRVRDSETVISDGPFAETKEVLGGYYLIDVADLDAALGWAARMPNIAYGSVEVRPVVVFP